MASLSEYGGMERNPIQEREYRAALDQAGIKWTDQGGKAFVEGFGTGGNAYGDQARSFFDPTNITNRNTMAALTKQQEEALARQKAETDARFASQKGEIGDYITRFGEKVPQVIDATSQKYNVTGLLDTANALNTRIKNLQGNLNNQGAGGYASAGQVDAAINSRYLPTYQTSVENLNRSASLAQNEAQQLLTPIVAEGSMLTDRLAREFTGYSQQQQRELDTLMAKMQTGLALTQMETQRMMNLAQLEQSKYEFQQTLAQRQKEFDAGNNQTPDRYLSGTNFYDTVLGQWITAPKQSSAKVSDGW